MTPRIDYQLSTNHTLTGRYNYNRDIVRNTGTGGLNLASRGYQNDARSQTLQLTETAALRSRIINETRFQYFRPSTIAQANSPGPALQVLGSFNGGGNPIGHSTNTQNNYEFQNNTSMLSNAHTWRFGIRVRATSETSVSPQNYAGTFTFSGGLAAPLDGSGQLLSISSIESYRRTLLAQQQGIPSPQLRQLGGGASQFSMNAGNPQIYGRPGRSRRFRRR